MAFGLITPAYFILDINIPNTGSEGSKVINTTIEKLNSFISKYQPECLINILGYPLYKLLGTETSDRMTALITGAEYINSKGQLTYWKGLTHDNISLIAYYVYYKFQEVGASQTTGVNTKVSAAEGGVSVSPLDKMVKAWNNFSKEVADLYCFLTSVGANYDPTNNSGLVFRSDEQIQVDVTAGLVSGATTETFDGTGGKPDYRGWSIVISEIGGRGILVNGYDYTFNSITGLFSLIQTGDKFQSLQYYNIHFNPIVGVQGNGGTVYTGIVFPEFTSCNYYEGMDFSARINVFGI